jgi:recombination protein RecA
MAKHTKDDEKEEKATKDNRHKDNKEKIKAQARELNGLELTDLSSDPKALEKTAAMLNKVFKSDVASFGKPAVDAKIFQTGVLSLDRAVGNGGLLAGRVVSSSGHEGTGKTMAAMTIGGAVQRSGGLVAFLDAEGTFDPRFARSCGLNPDTLQLIQSTPERIMTGEDYLGACRLLIGLGYNFIIIDSSAALVPGKKLQQQFGEGQPATQAAMMSEEFSKITAILNSTKKCIVYVINQIRMKPMVMFGKNEGPTGGEAIKFYASYGFEIRKVGDITAAVLTPAGNFEEKAIGVKVSLGIHKNKTASTPVYPVEFDIYTTFATDKEGIQYTPGVDVCKDAVEVGIITNVIQQSGAWFAFGELRAQGRDNLVSMFKKNPAELDKLRSVVLGQSATLVSQPTQPQASA